LASQLFGEINAYRAEKGLSPFKDRPLLTAYAYAQAWYNAENDVDNMAKHAIGMIGVSATITHDYDIPSNALWLWQNSPKGHNETLLYSEWAYIGVAVVEIKKRGATFEYVAMVCFDTEGIPRDNPGIAQ
jgi:uncharacterized protein YkwD